MYTLNELAVLSKMTNYVEHTVVVTKSLEFSNFYGLRRFITVFTKVRHNKTSRPSGSNSA
jgi:hypothetical protein